MGRRLLDIAGKYMKFYTEKRLTRASAAMSYHLFMTFFPLVICLYSLLGSSYDKAMRVLELAKQMMAEETVLYLADFLYYVADKNSVSMLAAAIAVLLGSASAAVRSMQTTVGELQGGQRFQGAAGYLFSIVYSLLFVAALYFAILVMLTGRGVIERINRLLPFIDISQSWAYMRFFAMAGIEYVIVWGMYEACKRSRDSYDTYPGAVFASLAMAGVSAAFSIFIGASARYPLVYGSLASVILLMLWLYTCCRVIYSGAALNILLWQEKKEIFRQEQKSEGGVL